MIHPAPGSPATDDRESPPDHRRDRGLDAPMPGPGATPTRNDDASRELIDRLTALADRRRAVRAVTAVADLWAILAATLLLWASIDALIGLDAPARTVLAVALAAITLLAAGLLLLPLLRRPSLIQTAFRIERRAPNLRERLVSVLELTLEPPPAVSASMIDRLRAEALQVLRGVTPRALMPYPVRRWLTPAAITTTGLFLAAFSGIDLPLQLKRVTFPSELDATAFPPRLQWTQPPPTHVLDGQRIRFEIQSDAPPHLVHELVLDDGDIKRFPATPLDASGRHAWTIAAPPRPFTATVVAGDARGPGVAVDVSPRPRIQQFEFDLLAAGPGATRTSSVGDLLGPQNAAVEVRARLSRPVDAAQVRGDPHARPVSIDPDGRGLTWVTALREPGEYRLAMRDAQTGAVVASLPYRILPQRDTPPVVNWADRDQALPPLLGQSRPIRWRATDDHGLSRFTLSVERNGRPVLRTDLPSNAERWDVTRPDDAAPGDVIAVRVGAHDLSGQTTWLPARRFLIGNDVDDVDDAAPIDLVESLDRLAAKLRRIEDRQRRAAELNLRLQQAAQGIRALTREDVVHHRGVLAAHASWLVDELQAALDDTATLQRTRDEPLALVAAGLARQRLGVAMWHAVAPPSLQPRAPRDAAIDRNIALARDVLVTLSRRLVERQSRRGVTRLAATLERVDGPDEHRRELVLATGQWFADQPPPTDPPTDAAWTLRDARQTVARRMEQAEDADGAVTAALAQAFEQARGASVDTLWLELAAALATHGAGDDEAWTQLDQRLGLMAIASDAVASDADDSRAGDSDPTPWLSEARQIATARRDPRLLDQAGAWQAALAHARRADDAARRLTAEADAPTSERRADARRADDRLLALRHVVAAVVHDASPPVLQAFARRPTDVDDAVVQAAWTEADLAAGRARRALASLLAAVDEPRGLVDAAQDAMAGWTDRGARGADELAPAAETARAALLAASQRWQDLAADGLETAAAPIERLWHVQRLALLQAASTGWAPAFFDVADAIAEAGADTDNASPPRDAAADSSNPPWLGPGARLADRTRELARIVAAYRAIQRGDFDPALASAFRERPDLLFPGAIDDPDAAAWLARLDELAQTTRPTDSPTSDRRRPTPLMRELMRTGERLLVELHGRILDAQADTVATSIADTLEESRLAWMTWRDAMRWSPPRATTDTTDPRRRLAMWRRQVERDLGRLTTMMETGRDPAAGDATARDAVDNPRPAPPGLLLRLLSGSVADWYEVIAARARAVDRWDESVDDILARRRAGVQTAASSGDPAPPPAAPIALDSAIARMRWRPNLSALDMLLRGLDQQAPLDDASRAAIEQAGRMRIQAEEALDAVVDRVRQDVIELDRALRQSDATPRHRLMLAALLMAVHRAEADRVEQILSLLERAVWTPTPIALQPRPAERDDGDSAEGGDRAVVSLDQMFLGSETADALDPLARRGYFRLPPPEAPGAATLRPPVVEALLRGDLQAAAARAPGEAKRDFAAAAERRPWRDAVREAAPGLREAMLQKAPWLDVTPTPSTDLARRQADERAILELVERLAEPRDPEADDLWVDLTVLERTRARAGRLTFPLWWNLGQPGPADPTAQSLLDRYRNEATVVLRAMNAGESDADDPGVADARVAVERRLRLASAVSLDAIAAVEPWRLPWLDWVARQPAHAAAADALERLANAHQHDEAEALLRHAAAAMRRRSAELLGRLAPETAAAWETLEAARGADATGPVAIAAWRALVASDGETLGRLAESGTLGREGRRLRSSWATHEQVDSGRTAQDRDAVSRVLALAAELETRLAAEAPRTLLWSELSDALRWAEAGARSMAARRVRSALLDVPWRVRTEVASLAMSPIPEVSDGGRDRDAALGDLLREAPESPLVIEARRRLAAGEPWAAPDPDRVSQVLAPIAAHVEGPGLALRTQIAAVATLRQALENGRWGEAAAQLTDLAFDDALSAAVGDAGWFDQRLRRRLRRTAVTASDPISARALRRSAEAVAEARYAEAREAAGPYWAAAIAELERRYRLALDEAQRAEARLTDRRRAGLPEPLLREVTQELESIESAAARRMARHDRAARAFDKARRAVELGFFTQAEETLRTLAPPPDPRDDIPGFTESILESLIAVREDRRAWRERVDDAAASADAWIAFAAREAARRRALGGRLATASGASRAAMEEAEQTREAARAGLDAVAAIDELVADAAWDAALEELWLTAPSLMLRRLRQAVDETRRPRSGTIPIGSGELLHPRDASLWRQWAGVELANARAMRPGPGQARRRLEAWHERRRLLIAATRRAAGSGWERLAEADPIATIAPPSPWPVPADETDAERPGPPLAAGDEDAIAQPPVVESVSAWRYSPFFERATRRYLLQLQSLRLQEEAAP